MHDADSLEELSIGADCNLVAVVVDVRDGIRRAGGDGGQALLKLFEGERAGRKGKAAEAGGTADFENNVLMGHLTESAQHIWKLARA